MSFNDNNEVTDVPVAYTYIGVDEITNDIQITRKTGLEIPDDDANDKTIACSAKRIDNARNQLCIVKQQANRNNNVIADICNLVFGISVTLLFTMWTSIPIYSIKGFWFYIGFTIIALISFFIWFWLKRTPHIDISERIDIILDNLPDPTKTQSLKGK